MTACTRVDGNGRPCGGAIDENGYCTKCWFAPPAPAEEEPTAGESNGSGQGRGASKQPSPGESSSTSTPSTAWRDGLGRGLVSVPSVPGSDPSSALLTDPHFPEHKRFCSNPKCPTWPTPVGRGRNGRPGLVEGHCTQCGASFSFKSLEPRLAKGDLVGGQYEVVGYLAHGGVGWVIYALDRHLDGNPVVLKTLINANDASAQAAAVAERRFLTEVQHPNIVRIYNFVQHPDPLTGTSVGYTVMEYVGGQSLSRLRAAGPLPLSQVLAYGLEILAAFEYLHGRGLLYCDLKPGNLIHSDQHQLKLIDLGAVRRITDTESQPWHSKGFSDPSHWQHPSVATDLYTVARTMAVLSFDFPDFKKRASTLPGPNEVKLLAEHESYYRLLRRATNPDPAQRFETAAAMAEQLRGVLREVASEDGRPRAEPSTLFGPELRAAAADAEGFPDVRVDAQAAAMALPDPQVDRSDPHAGLLAALAGTSPDEMWRGLLSVPDPSPEVRRQAVLALIELKRLDEAADELAKLELESPHDWRLAWCRGLLALMDDRLDDATQAFEAVYDAVPGEAAPKLALAICAELGGDARRARRHFETVWRTDNTYASAAFGVARARFSEGDRSGAAQALEAVPEASRYGVIARMAAMTARVRSLEPSEALVADTFDAAERLSTLEAELGPVRYHTARAEVLEAVLTRRLAHPDDPVSSRHKTILGVLLTERQLRLGLERSYRTLAEQLPHRGVDLVDRANKVRPLTWR